MHQNLAAGASLRTPLGSLQRSPRLPSWLTPIPKNPTPAQPFGLRALALASLWQCLFRSDATGRIFGIRGKSADLLWTLYRRNLKNNANTPILLYTRITWCLIAFPLTAKCVTLE